MTLSVAVNFKKWSFLLASILTICRAASQENNSTNKAQPLRSPQCGIVNKTDTVRVVGGSPADVGGWPWIANVGFEIDPDDGADFVCGGSLISSRHVLTAGHCVYGSTERIFVRLGEHDFSTDDEGANPIDILVKKVTIHPGYNNASYENDIAILELSKAVEFTDLIHPICLPVEDDLKNYNFVNHYLFVAGWGSTSTDGPFSDVLLETQIPVIDRQTCANSYRHVKNIVVDDRVICAGYEGTDSCEGDSGGPLIYPQNQTFYLIGIVSGGSERCAEPGIPGLYTRVTQFLDFILSCTN